MPTKAKPVCRYDPHCYQKNEDHLKKYSHPGREKKEKEKTHSKSPPRLPPTAIPPSASPPVVNKKAVSETPTPTATIKVGKPKPKRTWVQPQLSFSATTVSSSSTATIIASDPTVGGPPMPVPTDPPLGAKRPREGLSSTPVSSPAKQASGGSGGGSVVLGSPYRSPLGAKSPKKPRLEGEGETEDDDVTADLLVPPPPRPSPLKGTDPTAVYEMPFPMKEMNAILKVAKTISPSDPCRAFVKSCGIRLVGPFQVMLGYEYKSDIDKWTHWRQRYDPPEVQTIFVEDPSGPSAPHHSHETKGKEKEAPAHDGHYCLHRDAPDKLPTMVVRGTAHGAKFSIVSASIVAALAGRLPSEAHPVAAALLAEFPAGSPSVHSPTAATKARNHALIAKTVSGLGMVVPYVKKTELGYREPMYSNSHFLSLVKASGNGTATPKQQEDLYDQYRFADIANDECDFGLSLELGLNMLTVCRSRNTVSANTFRILDTAYMLLGRELFRHILRCHFPLLVGSGK